MGNLWRYLVLAGAAGSIACASDDGRPSGLLDGDGGSGVGLPDIGCEPKPSQGKALDGKIFVFADDAFSREPAIAEDYEGKVELQIEAFPCELLVQEYDATIGGPNFFIQGAKGGQNWLRRAQLEGTADVYPTISPITTDANPENIDFHFAKQSVVDQIYGDTGVEPDPTRATMVLRNGTDAIAPGSELKACKVGGVWTLAMCNEGPPAVFLNVTADPYPGTQSVITVGGKSFSPVLAAGALTVFDVAVGI